MSGRGNGAAIKVALATGGAAIEQYIPALARSEADRARKTKKPISWSAALNKAPWSDTLPAAWEAGFRRSYAKRLVELGLALPAAKSGTTSGKGGRTDLKRLPSIYLSEAELASAKARARHAGLTLSSWVRRRISE